ncbi:MAG: tetratricopeptide repeat protein [Bryobacteraceae bacterium]
MKVLTALLWGCCLLGAGECTPSNLSEKETLQKFQQLDRAAQSAFDRGQFAAAAEQYREATCLAPKSARAFYGLGIAEAAAGQFPAARRALESAYSILPDNVMPLAMLVRVEVAMKDVDRLKQVLSLAADRFPKNAELHASLGRFLAENQLLDLALAESLRAEQAGSRDQASAVALAVLENTVGAYEDAIRTARLVEDQSTAPDSVKAAAAGVSGLSYESTGERDEAVKHLKRAVELSPRQENSYLALAFLYEKAQRFKEAVEVLESGRTELTDSSHLLLPLGNNLVWSEQYDSGIGVLKNLIQRDPGTPEAYIRLAEAYRNTGRPELEIQTLQRLGAVKPDYPMLGLITARAMLSKNPADYPAVLHMLAQAEKSTPLDWEVFYVRGKAYAAIGRNQDAITALRRAIELRPMDAAPYYQLGTVYRKAGQPELARQTFQRMEQVKKTVQ